MMREAGIVASDMAKIHADVGTGSPMGVGISDLPVTPEINGEIGAATVKSIPVGIEMQQIM